MHLLHIFFDFDDMLFGKLYWHQMWGTTLWVVVSIVSHVAEGLSWDLWDTVSAVVTIVSVHIVWTVLLVCFCCWIVMEDEAVAATRCIWAIANAITHRAIFIRFIWARIGATDVATLRSVILFDIVAWVHASLAPVASPWSSLITLSNFLVSILFGFCCFGSPILFEHSLFSSISGIVQIAWIAAWILTLLIDHCLYWIHLLNVV